LHAASESDSPQYQNGIKIKTMDEAAVLMMARSEMDFHTVGSSHAGRGSGRGRAVPLSLGMSTNAATDTARASKRHRVFMFWFFEAITHE